MDGNALCPRAARDKDIQRQGGRLALVSYPLGLGHLPGKCELKKAQDRASGKLPADKSGDKSGDNVLRMNKALAAVIKSDQDSD
jgi:hypothetical protein